MEIVYNNPLKQQTEPLIRPPLGSTEKQRTQFMNLVIGLAKDEIYYRMTGNDSPYGNPDDPNKRKEGVDAMINKAISEGEYRDISGKTQKVPGLMHYNAPSDAAIEIANFRIRRMTSENR